MKIYGLLAVVLVVGCGGVTAAEPGDGAAGSSAGAAGKLGSATGGAGSSGGTTGAAGASAAGVGGAGTSGAAGTGSAGAGGSGGSDAGAGGAGLAGAAGGGAPSGLIDGKPWCDVARPADYVPDCKSFYFTAEEIKTIPATGTPAGRSCMKTKVVPIFGTLACWHCIDAAGKSQDNCTSGDANRTFQDYPTPGASLSCYWPTVLCVKDCGECP